MDFPTGNLKSTQTGYTSGFNKIQQNIQNVITVIVVEL